MKPRKSYTTEQFATEILNVEPKALKQTPLSIFFRLLSLLNQKSDVQYRMEFQVIPKKKKKK
jgi:hypothetical protein